MNTFRTPFVSIKMLISKLDHVIMQFINVVFFFAVFAQFLQFLLDPEFPSLLSFRVGGLKQLVHLLLLIILMKLLHRDFVVVMFPMLGLKCVYVNYFLI